MGHFLFCVLLLAVFFNTAAKVVHGALPSAQLSSRIAHENGSADASATASCCGPDEDDHGLCFWCLAYAQPFNALTTQVHTLAANGETGSESIACVKAKYSLRDSRRHFAARGPPIAI